MSMKGIFFAAALAFLPIIGHAYDDSDRPIKIVVPFAPGGITDSVARIGAKWLSTDLRKPVIVDNRPGAGGAIAADIVARAPADGYTLFLASLPQIAILPAMQPVKYDPVKDFEPVSIIGVSPMVLVVNPKVPVNSVDEFIRYVKNSPTPIAYGSAGNGTITHLAMVKFLEAANLTMNHIPYKGGASAMADVLANQIPTYFGNVSEVAQHVKAGKLRALAVSSTKRVSTLPDTPTIAELGFANYSAETWTGIMAPAKTSAEIVNKLSESLIRSVHNPAVAKQLEDIGVTLVGNTPSEFAAWRDRDIKTWSTAARKILSENTN